MSGTNSLSFIFCDLQHGRKVEVCGNGTTLSEYGQRVNTVKGRQLNPFLASVRNWTLIRGFDQPCCPYAR
jgi:hypothetical protein